MHNSNESQARNPIVPLAKAEGAFLALAAGDALGWPQEMPRNILGNRGNAGTHVEFEEWKRRGRRTIPSLRRSHPFRRIQRRYAAHPRSRAQQNSSWPGVVEGVHADRASSLDSVRTRRRGEPPSVPPMRGPVAVHHGSRARETVSAGTSRQVAMESPCGFCRMRCFSRDRTTRPLSCTTWFSMERPRMAIRVH